ncbi:MAG: hypothetical protein HYY03_00480 [Chloroflexi bacterium]|nr:hypothetical protein [Chloroflexota bacterium]
MASVNVTERAAEELRSVLAGASPEEGQALRLLVEPGGRFGLGLDQAREDDERVESGGQVVLVLAPAVAQVMEGALIDVQETGEGPRLTISR